MPETLLSVSNILLYGRVLRDLQYNPVGPPDHIPEDDGGITSPAPPRLGGNNFLQNQLEFRDGDHCHFARIYGFSYEGQYYDLARPVVFLVHGPGARPEPLPAANSPQARYSRAPSGADRSGVASQSGSFAEDIKVWSYDKADFSIRFDMETGPFEEILLEAELLSEEVGTHFSGAHARVSGAHARVSGAHARVSGAHARIRGNRGGGGGD